MCFVETNVLRRVDFTHFMHSTSKIHTRKLFLHPILVLIFVLQMSPSSLEGTSSAVFFLFFFHFLRTSVSYSNSKQQLDVALDILRIRVALRRVYGLVLYVKWYIEWEFRRTT